MWHLTTDNVINQSVAKDRGKNERSSWLCLCSPERSITRSSPAVPGHVSAEQPKEAAEEEEDENTAAIR